MLLSISGSGLLRFFTILLILFRKVLSKLNVVKYVMEGDLMNW